MLAKLELRFRRSTYNSFYYDYDSIECVATADEETSIFKSSQIKNKVKGLRKSMTGNIAEALFIKQYKPK